MTTKKPTQPPIKKKKLTPACSNGKHPGGRPTEYQEEYNNQAYKLTLLGAIDKQIADFFEVSEQTLNTWKQKHPKFVESLKKGKDFSDNKVVESLYQRAMGYEHDSEEIKTVSIGNGMSEIERVPVRKKYPPDTIAAIFWLKNRQPENWRDKQDIEHSGPDGKAITINIIPA